MGKTIYVVEQRKDRSEWLVIFAAAALIAFWKWILVACIILATSWFLVHGYHWLEEAKVQKRAKQARILMDAPTKLITEGMRVWGNPEHYLDNYDDGMREWR
jgi:hypothetical protein